MNSRLVHLAMSSRIGYISSMEFDREKFKTLVLYVIWRTSAYPTFGAIKLNKVLWFSDARTFEAFGKSVSGETYIRRKFGPVPRHVDEVIDELRREQLIEVWSEPYYEFEVKRYSTHRPPDTTVFTPDELGFIDWWIKHVAEEHTAKSISEKSHDYGWRIAQDGEELPFNAYLAKRLRPPSEGEELDWALEVANEIEAKARESS